MVESGTRFDKDSYYKTMVDEENNTARIIGENNGVPVDWVVGGSSDFSTAEVTVTISTRGAYIGLSVVMLGGEGEEGFTQALEVAESGVYTVILYEGNCLVFAESYVDNKMAIVSVTGNAETMGDSVFTIKGDCAVTVTLQDIE